jgi:hypothetical protein
MKRAAPNQFEAACGGSEAAVLTGVNLPSNKALEYLVARSTLSRYRCLSATIVALQLARTIVEH